MYCIYIIHVLYIYTCTVYTFFFSLLQSFLTSTLLKIYGELDDRVQPLCVAFKHWAKVQYSDVIIVVCDTC